MGEWVLMLAAPVFLVGLLMMRRWNREKSIDYRSALRYFTLAGTLYAAGATIIGIWLVFFYQATLWLRVAALLAQVLLIAVIVSGILRVRPWRSVSPGTHQE